MSGFLYKEGQTFKATLEIVEVDIEDEDNYPYRLTVQNLELQDTIWVSEQELLDAFDPERKKFLLRQKKAEIEEQLKQLEG
jgi:NADH pyrophosphatase NudC (nudix superfamily)